MNVNLKINEQKQITGTGNGVALSKVSFLCCIRAQFTKKRIKVVFLPNC